MPNHKEYHDFFKNETKNGKTHEEREKGVYHHEEGTWYCYYCQKEIKIKSRKSHLNTVTHLLEIELYYDKVFV